MKNVHTLNNVKKLFSLVWPSLFKLLKLLKKKWHTDCLSVPMGIIRGYLILILSLILAITFASPAISGGKIDDGGGAFITDDPEAFLEVAKSKLLNIIHNGNPQIFASLPKAFDQNWLSNTVKNIGIDTMARATKVQTSDLGITNTAPALFTYDPINKRINATADFLQLIALLGPIDAQGKAYHPEELHEKVRNEILLQISKLAKQAGSKHHPEKLAKSISNAIAHDTVVCEGEVPTFFGRKNKAWIFNRSTGQTFYYQTIYSDGTNAPPFKDFLFQNGFSPSLMKKVDFMQSIKRGLDYHVFDRIINRYQLKTKKLSDSTFRYQKNGGVNFAYDFDANIIYQEGKIAAARLLINTYIGKGRYKKEEKLMLCRTYFDNSESDIQYSPESPLFSSTQSSSITQKAHSTDKNSSPINPVQFIESTKGKLVDILTNSSPSLFTNFPEGYDRDWLIEKVRNMKIAKDSRPNREKKMRDGNLMQVPLLLDYDLDKGQITATGNLIDTLNSLSANDLLGVDYTIEQLQEKIMNKIIHETSHLAKIGITSETDHQSKALAQKVSEHTSKDTVLCTAKIPEWPEYRREPVWIFNRSTGRTLFTYDGEHGYIAEMLHDHGFSSKGLSNLNFYMGHIEISDHDMSKNLLSITQIDPHRFIYRKNNGHGANFYAEILYNGTESATAILQIDQSSDLDGKPTNGKNRIQMSCHTNSNPIDPKHQLDQSLGQILNIPDRQEIIPNDQGVKIQKTLASKDEEGKANKTKASLAVDEIRRMNEEMDRENGV